MSIPKEDVQHGLFGADPQWPDKKSMIIQASSKDDFCRRGLKRNRSNHYRRSCLEVRCYVKLQNHVIRTYKKEAVGLASSTPNSSSSSAQGPRIRLPGQWQRTGSPVCVLRSNGQTARGCLSQSVMLGIVVLAQARSSGTRPTHL